MPLYSHSRLSTYENCPRHYAFRYIEKPEIEKMDTIEAFLGSRAHETLQRLYEDVEMERTPDWEDVRGDFDARWEREWSDRVTIVRGDYTPDDYRNVGRRCLKEYFVRYYPFRWGKVIGLEKHILVDLSPGSDNGYKLQGYIDRLVDLGNGEYEIHDYKTSREVPEQERLDNDRQLALYQIGVQTRYPDAQQVHLVWHYLRADREVRSHRAPEQLNQLKMQTMELIDEIQEKERKNDLPPRESMLCEWCEYYSVCPAKRHLVATRELSATEFSADQGVILADKLIEAKRQLSSAESNAEVARQLLLDFASQQKITVVRGHDAKVRISHVPVVRLPSQERAPENLVQLESIVRGTGKWDQVTRLWDKRLRDALQTDLFNSEIRKKISSLLVHSTEPHVRILRLSEREREE